MEPGLGGHGWWSSWFNFSAFTAFAQLSVQNHFLGDAGHLTVGHGVGSGPAIHRSFGQPPHQTRKSRKNPSDGSNSLLIV